MIERDQDLRARFEMGDPNHFAWEQTAAYMADEDDCYESEPPTCRTGAL